VEEIGLSKVVSLSEKVVLVLLAVEAGAIYLYNLCAFICSLVALDDRVCGAPIALPLGWVWLSACCGTATGRSAPPEGRGR